MIKPLQRWVLNALVASMVLGLLPVVPAQAAGVGCSVGNLTVVVGPGNQAYLGLQITNTAATPLQWIRIARPNADYSITSSSVADWSIASDVASLVLTGDSLGSGNVLPVDLWAGANKWQADPANWTVSASSDPGGSGAVNCAGTVTVSTQADYPPGGEGQGISAVTVDPTFTSAIVRWQTDFPTGSAVSFGPTTSYGTSTVYDGTMATSHQMVVSGLTAGTVYHFRVEGVDENGVVVYSGDNTFSTLSASGDSGDTGNTGSAGNTGGQPTSPVVTPAAKPPVPRGTVAIKAKPTEKEPPMVVVATDLSKPFARVPDIGGVARDNAAVARVDYSLDGGKNWVVIQNPAGLGSKEVRFSFAPGKLEDGNYRLVVRATDTSGNEALTLPAVMVIDQEPPRIGTAMVSFGPQAAGLDKAGRWETAVGINETIGLNAVGGPVSITVVAAKDDKSTPQNFYLRQDASSGLWKGFLSYTRPGLYRLSAIAVDGAGNRTTRVLPDMVVTAAAQVSEATGGRPVENGTVTVFYRQPEAKRWFVWDGGAYGEVNPQQITKNGNFSLLVPPGTYYMKVEASGFKTVVTKTFSVDKPTPLVPALKLTKRVQWHLGSWTWTWPGITLSQTSIDPAAQAVATAAGAKLAGHNLPNFSLPTTVGDTATPVKLQGKSTIVTVLATWAPSADEQLPALDAFAKKRPDVNVRLLYLGERAGKVQTVLAQAGYDLTAIIDAHATLGDVLGAASAPTHYFIDREGKVKAVETGVLRSGDLEAGLNGL